MGRFICLQDWNCDLIESHVKCGHVTWVWSKLPGKVFPILHDVLHPIPMSHAITLPSAVCVSIGRIGVGCDPLVSERVLLLPLLYS